MSDSAPSPTQQHALARRWALAGWLWLAVGLPVALFVLCGGFMMAMASLAVVASDDATSIIVDEAARVPDNGR